VDDLSSDQYYGYRICLAVMSGYLDPDLQKLQIVCVRVEPVSILTHQTHCPGFGKER